ncbi:MAG: hypothetical protein R2783_05875 [Gelidibacter sp.]
MKKNNLNTNVPTGFKVPKDYFESLEDSVVSKLKAEQLSIEFNSSGFKVPNGYFETVDSKILNAIEGHNATKAIPLFGWKKLTYISGIAASILLMLNLLFESSERPVFDDLETASIETYLSQEDLNPYDIASYLNEDDLTKDTFIDKQLSEEAIEDYLLQNSDVEHLITD